MKSDRGKSKKMRLPEDDKIINKKGYYFHSDEDFKEDFDWGKQKVIASKAISKPSNKFEI
ncbi:hypothetical protein [Pedobacter nyackensis]|nr:hypothetical protein [Pedobacter nyackensis]